MSKTDHRTACPECKSNNNLCFWTYNGKQYSKCQTPGCEYNKSYNKSISNTMTLNNTYKEDNLEFLTGEFKETRGLTIETCKAFGIMVQGDRHIFNYTNAQKVRIPRANGKKDMYWVGTSSEAGLFGEHLEYDKTKPIVITEGEFDAASCYQAGYQAYSIKNGAGERKTADEIKTALPRISEFKEIIFWFDSDQAGIAALQEVLALEDLPIEKVKIVKNTMYKDANEALCADLIEEVQSHVSCIIDDAEEYVPEGILLGETLSKEKLLQKSKPGMKIRIEPLNTMLDGLKFGKLVLVGAGSNIGKTPFLKKLGYDLFNDYPDVKIANLYLEETLQETGLSYIAFDNNVLVNDLLKDPLQYITQEQFDEGYKKYIESERLMFTNDQYSLDSAGLMKNLNYLTKKGFNVFIIDHISLIVDASASKEGERKDIDRLMQKLSQFVKSTNTLVIAACHLSNPDQGLDWEEGREVRQKDFRGSGALRQYPHVMIGIERNLREENTRKFSKIRVVKNRGRGSYVGEAGALCIKDCSEYLTTLDNIFEG